MSNDQFAAFMSGGIILLVAAALAIAWILWRERDARIDMTRSALEGVGHEFRINVQRIITELSMVAHNELPGPSALLPISHPQLDGVNANLVETNRKALAVINATYLELTARKELVREAIIKDTNIASELTDAIYASIDAITTLYLWEEHKGVSPHEARSTRSWSVRDWMKEHSFQNDAFPDLHLRDQVVERLRSYGMPLTPKPLTHTAHEYYSMRYDRYADPRSPFGRRKTDDDGNVIRKEKNKRLKLPTRKDVESSGNGAAAPVTSEPQASAESDDDANTGRMAKLKDRLASIRNREEKADREPKESGGRFSAVTGLINKVRNRGDSAPPPSE